MSEVGFLPTLNEADYFWTTSMTQLYYQLYAIDKVVVDELTLGIAALNNSAQVHAANARHFHAINDLVSEAAELALEKIDLDNATKAEHDRSNAQTNLDTYLGLFPNFSDNTLKWSFKTKEEAILSDMDPQKLGLKLGENEYGSGDSWQLTRSRGAYVDIDSNIIINYLTDVDLTTGIHVTDGYGPHIFRGFNYFIQLWEYRYRLAVPFIHADNGQTTFNYYGTVVGFPKNYAENKNFVPADFIDTYWDIHYPPYLPQFYSDVTGALSIPFETVGNGYGGFYLFGPITKPTLEVNLNLYYGKPQIGPNNFQAQVGEKNVLTKYRLGTPFIRAKFGENNDRIGVIRTRSVTDSGYIIYEEVDGEPSGLGLIYNRYGNLVYLFNNVTADILRNYL